MSIDSIYNFTEGNIAKIPRGGTPRVNRQRGQDLKKIITPKKYLKLTKNTQRLARP